MMKSLVKFFFAVSAFIMCAVSCSDANDTTEGYSVDIFTIEGQRVVPESSDTFFVVSNVETMGLKTGDRALLRLNFFIDNVVGMKGAKYEIGEVYEIYPVYDIVDAATVDRNEYTSALTGLTGYYYDRYNRSVWAKNGYQNMNVVYKSDGTEPEFKMVLTGYDNDTLRFSLLSKITDGDKSSTEFLCFNLKSVISLLDSEQVNNILRTDSLNTKITVKHFDSEDETVYERTIIGGKLANPFK